MMNIKLTLISLWMLLTDECQGKGYCSFPRFVWTPMPDGTNRKWLWRTEYFLGADGWESQNEVTTMETEIIVQEKVHTPCNRDSVNLEYSLPCYRHDTVYHLICITEEPGGKYRVQQQHPQGTSFTCLQFKHVSPDVVIVYKAATKNLNEDRLCYDVSLQRDPWPWIAPVRSQWSFCPLHGGFDFTAVYGKSGQDTCPGEWRPSRIESECVMGEGATFFFPGDRCNFFGTKEHEQSFQCWATWREDSQRFILFGKRARQPRYVLRIPEQADNFDELTAYLYTSPIAVLSSGGTIPNDTDITYMVMKMLRSEPGNCYDESSLCAQYAQQGKCTNSALHHYGNYCKRSCGLCDFAPSPKAECNYATRVQGDWLLFDDVSREEVAIGVDNVRFSTLGSYVCKSKHWEQDLYKTLSVFTNGCRPRYSCLYLKRDEGNLVEFKLSHSSPVDTSFQMCRFEDDPLPLGGKIRSKKEKMLLPISSMFYGSCGIGGLVRAEVNINGKRMCSGRIWDVDLTNCDAKSTLSVSLPKCHIYEEFLCEAFTRFSDGGGFLVLKHLTEEAEDYYCWRFMESASEKLKYQTIKLERIHCDTSKAYEFVFGKHWLLAIQLHRDLVDETCGRFPVEIRDDAASLNWLTRRPVAANTPRTIFAEKQTAPTSAAKNSAIKDKADTLTQARNSQNRHTGYPEDNTDPDGVQAYLPAPGSDRNVYHTSHKTRDAENRLAFNHVLTSSTAISTVNVYLLSSLLVSVSLVWCTTFKATHRPF